MPRTLCVRALLVHVPYSGAACGNCWRDRIKAPLKQQRFHPHSVFKTSSDCCESSDRFDFPHALHSLSMTTAERNASLARGPLESSDPHMQLRLGAFVRAEAHIRCAIQFLGPW